MAGPIIPAMHLATALVLGIPSYWPWHSSCCWNVTAADRCAVAAVHVHAAAAAISVPAMSRCRCHRRCRRQGRGRGLSSRLMSLARQAPKKAARMPFIAALLISAFGGVHRFSQVLSAVWDAD